MAFPAPALEADVITFQPWDAYVIVEAVESVGAAAKIINLVGRAAPTASMLTSEWEWDKTSTHLHVS